MRDSMIDIRTVRHNLALGYNGAVALQPHYSGEGMSTPARSRRLACIRPSVPCVLSMITRSGIITSPTQQWRCVSAECSTTPYLNVLMLFFSRYCTLLCSQFFLNYDKKLPKNVSIKYFSYCFWYEC